MPITHTYCYHHNAIFYIFLIKIELHPTPPQPPPPARYHDYQSMFAFSVVLFLVSQTIDTSDASLIFILITITRQRSDSLKSNFLFI